MVMADTKAIHAVSQVYESSEAKGFTESEQYPVALEIIFVNDAVGKEFAINSAMALARMPKEKGHVLSFEGDGSDSVRCLECVFKDGNSLRQFLNEALPNMTIYDHEQGVVVPKQALIDKAKEIALQPTSAVGYGY